jgi:hypothetical protein
VPLEAPATTIPATPSNFGAAMQARSEAAQAPQAEPQAEARPQRGGRPSDFRNRVVNADNNDAGADMLDTRQYRSNEDVDDNPYLTNPSDAESQESDELEAATADDTSEDVFETDEFGNEINVSEIERQRAAALTEISEALAEGRFPHEQLKDFPIEVMVNGEKREVSLEECRQGYMRQANATRKLAEAKQIQSRADQLIQLERARTQEWAQRPQTLRQDMEAMGLKGSFEAAARDWAKERFAYLQMPPQERQFHDQQQFLARENARIAAERRALEVQRNPPQDGPSPETIAAAKAIENLMPKALKGQGIRSYPLANQLFVQNLSILCEDGNVTPEVARQAAIAVREQLEDMHAAQPVARSKRAAAEAARAPNGQFAGKPTGPSKFPLGPRRLGSGSPVRPKGLPLTLGTTQQPTSAGRGPTTSSSGQKGVRPSQAFGRMGLA